MRELLRHFQRCGEVPLHPTELARRVGGTERLAQLRALGVVVDRERPTALPCAGMGDCHREVVERAGDREYPFVAVCGADSPRCESQLLTVLDVARASVSTEALARAIARALGLDDARVCRGDGSWTLGHADGRAFILATAPWARGFEMLLLAQSGAATILAPCRDRVPSVLEQRYRKGERVDLRFLEDELVLQGGRVLRRTVASGNPAHFATATRTVLERAGERRVTNAEYAAIVAGNADLVLDLTSATEHGGYPVRVRATEHRRGRKERVVSLPARQAHAIVELVRAAGRPLRAAELRCLRDAEVRDPERLVEIARKAIDTPLSRYQWRAFHTVRGATPDAKAYAFRPPPDYEFAVFMPPLSS